MKKQSFGKIRKCRIGLIGGALLMLANMSFAVEPVQVKEGTLYGRPVIEVDNGLLRMTVTPEIGGRGLSIVEHRTGYEFVRVAPWYMHLNEGDPWIGAEYGGMSDVDGGTWPGNFWSKTYTARVERPEEGVVVLRLSAEAAGTVLERTITIRRGSTRVGICVTQRNTADYTRPMAIWIHGEHRLGQRADDNDYAYWIDPDGCRQWMHYVPGVERLNWQHVWRFRRVQAVGWFAAVDRRDAVAMAAVYPDTDKPVTVAWWNGFVEGDANIPERDQDGGFFNMDRVTENQPVEPGGAISAVQDLILLRGMDRSVRAAQGDVVVAADADRASAVYGSREPIGLVLQAGAAVATTGCSATVAAIRKDGDKDGPVAHRMELRIGPTLPGEAQSTNVLFPAGVLTDGAYDLLVQVTAGKTQLRPFRVPVVVNAAQVNDLTDHCRALVDRLNSLEKRADGLSDSTTPERVKVLRGVAELRRGRLDQALAEGRFDRVQLRADDLDTILRDLEAALDQPAEKRTADPAVEKEWKLWSARLAGS